MDRVQSWRVDAKAYISGQTCPHFVVYMNELRVGHQSHKIDIPGFSAVQVEFTIDSVEVDGVDANELLDLKREVLALTEQLQEKRQHIARLTEKLRQACSDRDHEVVFVLVRPAAEEVTPAP